MAGRYEAVQEELRKTPRKWLVTGAAGFIGSNLVEALLKLGQHVIGLDNFATGHKRNLCDVQQSVGAQLSNNFEFVEGDILHQSLCRELCQGVDVVLHQAALGSVPRSIKDPFLSNQVNVDGFISMMLAARDAGVKRFVYASSSSVYGDSTQLPKVEDQIGNPLSPYAATKRINEMYAHIFTSLYGTTVIGLRYFNVFGPRQDPAGQYAAVVPKWIEARLKKQPCVIFGDGLTSRDFCFVANAVQANILAALAPEEGVNTEYNIAVNDQTSLNDLYSIIEELINPSCSERPVHEDFRTGDVRHSRADINKACKLLGYQPAAAVKEGLRQTVDWYRSRSAK